MSRFYRILVGFGILLFSATAFSQKLNELTPGYYIVVGAYSKSQERMAQQFVEVLKGKGYSADYGFNSGKNFYFVYLKYFNNLRESLHDMKNTREAGTFTDAWVRVVSGDIPTAPEVISDSSRPPGSTPISSSKTAEKQATDEVLVESIAQDQTTITDNPEIVQYPVMTLGNTEVFLSLFNARNNRIVEGDVEVVDTERVKLMAKVKGNEYLNLPDPKSKSGQLTLICDVFGYRKIQQEINYPLPLVDTVKDFVDLMGTTLVINFNLVRYHKGDLATLFNVYFYNDASLMLPESKYELNNLLQLMQENPRYRIRLHGHTNGSYHGKIITMGPEKNLFSLTGSAQQVGSAKELSYDRAQIVKQYLVSEGIQPDRMELKGWGGRRPIYDKNSANARKNVRVEVEILED
ncbi:MAG TPA: OmpA family protein [Chryseolinea sp.]|jgi:outer membrane protein OmpA-like peptidoglycan-associated protein|nr:OmpA family protein [Chryseolinea sp.]